MLFHVRSKGTTPKDDKKSNNIVHNNKTIGMIIDRAKSVPRWVLVILGLILSCSTVKSSFSK
ncbi:hypothetical protein KDW_40500 [Dictyobacter vulcani]|uniref:Uncharacterized protein n=1 Tax=Dictyobacter vulcani TaxID=2607529 RepID=A0A5J4KJI8_9CHLR|nr:hypothetical protein KDW_40500 [Dictyobacter vulcani]